MERWEKLVLIMSSYILGFFTTLTALPMLPEHLIIWWIAFQVYFWCIAPLFIIWADRKEKNGNFNS